MSTHPNAILMAVFTPDALARKTYRAIVEEYKYSDSDLDRDVRIPFVLSDDHEHFENDRFCTFVVEDGDSDNACQIQAPEGSIVVHAFLTYGYYEKVEWDYVYYMYSALQTWAIEVDKKYNCSHKIYITANYW